MLDIGGWNLCARVGGRLLALRGRVGDLSPWESLWLDVACLQLGLREEERGGVVHSSLAGVVQSAKCAPQKEDDGEGETSR